MPNALDHLRAEIFSEYRKTTKGSADLFARAQAVLPGGVSGNLRFFAPYPLYMSGGQGSRTTDVDGNSYIDCFSCNGPLMLGHRPPSVEKAIDQSRTVGSLVLNPKLMIECAELLRDTVPCAQSVRFLNSGTEAVLSAVRCARAFTKRDKIIKFFGHYHGQADPMLFGLVTDRTALGDGVPASSASDVLILPFNDSAAFLELVDARDDIAAVLLDPAMHSGGLWGADPQFLQTVRDKTLEKQIVLIFDEVITGFRLGLKGAQGYFGVTPDMATFAKALAAGEKLGAVVGRSDILAVTDPLAAAGTPRAFQSGTGNDGTAALAAAVAAMQEYHRLDKQGEYEKLAQKSSLLEQRLQGAFKGHSIPLHVNRLGSMMQLFVSDEQAEFSRYAQLPTDLVELFYLALITRGVMLSLPTSNHIYMSFAHSSKDFSDVASAAEDVLSAFPFAEAYQEQAK